VYKVLFGSRTLLGNESESCLHIATGVVTTGYADIEENNKIKHTADCKNPEGNEK
jgi:hypothetical protein